ncbi:MAG: hypothetical protein A3F82_01785 [Deltaproteobacteria bacterium RIFCSPLOWO2_12_FULL_44_12]|nr:MAG: hypothetical protein A2712_03175 [Deltaproteobacteria bacterium RIFCSPHIGHO2_01_FULL_43_49]OGQ16195.1 MAG: hypothetical protein A3D22_01145 [Deltaproteobacteria bacterium RIFCSPHIGHO2_02_FULL_44_53]OGQ29155.1 MAG: hypothetical protein A3D98_04930 [Deltaproteobacteria bacterium RIFCSPHIGHO2_12_FULL_44_21]OGQ32712.1 MAG: hypothetical protein A2979_09075 [Deltaproteobacteria bacterium RIFCSPLOWO2_01_FULL_45_74]OGQ41814.1 MAG: hypothetical protein A3I70_08860 [Deltaproteobacteria bacterium 
MASLTLSIPEELREKMREFPEINWSEVARQAILEKAKLLEKMNRMLKAGGLDETEIPELDREVKKRVWKKHRS